MPERAALPPQSAGPPTEPAPHPRASAPLAEGGVGQRSPSFWRSLEEKADTPSAQDEFLPGALDPDPPRVAARLSRRAFFGRLGTAAVALATSTACDRKQRAALVPYTRRPVELVPGVANHYASTFSEGRRSHAVLVKTREGRPIHLTGNDEHPGLKGKTTVRAQAAVQGLYDPGRLRRPRIQGRPASWAQAETHLASALAQARDSGRRILFLTRALNSPTSQALMARLQAALPTLDQLAWEPAVADSGEWASRHCFDRTALILPRLEGIQVILSLGAEFLDGNDPEAAAAFTAQRHPRDPVSTLNRLWVWEGPLSLTGCNADERFPISPSRIGGLAFALARRLHAHHGLPLPPGCDLSGVPEGLPEAAGIPALAWTRLAEDLVRAGPRAVVLCGGPMPAEAHEATHLLNAMLASRGVEVREAEQLATREDLAGAIRAMNAGTYGVALLWGVDPAFAHPEATAWASAFARVPTRAWLGQADNASAALCQLVLPEHHWLESWGDFTDGELLTLRQPAIGPLYDSRQGEDLLLALAARLTPRPPIEGPGDYRAYLEARWRREVQAPGSPVPFERFFQGALHDGLLRLERHPPSPPRYCGGPAVAGAVAMALRRAADAPKGGFELLLRPCSQLHDGRYASSGWLQELPDPVSKTTWGNPLTLAVADGRRLGLQDGDLVRLRVGNLELEIPVHLQPGQAPGVLAVALGHGRFHPLPGRSVGVNAFPLLNRDPSCSNLRLDAALTPSGKRQALPITQNHHRMEGRERVHTFTLLEFVQAARSRRAAPEPASLYPDRTFPEHKWGMAIDLAACTGCSACVLGCQSENNIPTVGPEQVIRGREMHWMRIDSYYTGDEDQPRVVHQPMLCQHCDDAPCENVCPVNATTHSPDGLNQMVYNRCVGTRYCANNCPYKVRRFNFLEYTAGKAEPEDLQFNPEVTVRPRGVMEKCTFCVQRIQDARMRVKQEERSIRDGDIVPACQAACPTSAIVFGDLLDPQSQVVRLAGSPRGHKVLEYLGTRPAITYLADLKNPAWPGLADKPSLQQDAPAPASPPGGSP